MGGDALLVSTDITAAPGEGGLPVPHKTAFPSLPKVMGHMSGCVYFVPMVSLLGLDRQELYMNLGRTDIFTILSLLTHDRGA